MKLNPTGGKAREDIVIALDNMKSSFKKISLAQKSDRAEWNRAIASHEAGPGMRRENTAEIETNNQEFLKKLQDFRAGFYDFNQLYDNDKRGAVKLIKDTEKFLKDYNL